MLNDFYDNELEQFLQDQTAKHKMFPSDKIWRNIDKQLHGKKQWPGLIMVTLFIVAALTVTTIFLKYDTVDFGAVPDETNKLAESKNVSAALVDLSDRLNLKRAEDISSTTDNLNIIVDKPSEKNNIIAADSKQIAANNAVKTTIAVHAQKAKYQSQKNITENNLEIVEAENEEAELKLYTSNIGSLKSNNNLAKPAIGNLSPALQKEEKIESINNTESLTVATFKPKPAKWNFQLFIAPSISYRRLVEETIEKGTGAVVARNSRAINKKVNQKPAAGFEIGFATTYTVNKRFKISTGIQINSRKYQAPAYFNNLQVATVQLTGGGGADSFTAYTNYSLQEGNMQTTLVNSFYQISAPVGVEWSIKNNNRFGIALQASLQPTYTISQSSYILSADQKQYVDGNPLLRRWNINSSLGAIFSYQTGEVTWMLGPQVRYQHLPNYKTPYPIKEYLIDYGMKIGFSKSF